MARRQPAQLHHNFPRGAQQRSSCSRVLLLAGLLLQLERPLEDTIRFARQRNLPLIIDGSGLNFVANRLQLVQGYANCILTPNIAEFGRLAKAAGVQLEGPMSTQWQKHVSELLLSGCVVATADLRRQHISSVPLVHLQLLRLKGINCIKCLTHICAWHASRAAYVQHQVLTAEPLSIRALRALPANLVCLSCPSCRRRSWLAPSVVPCLCPRGVWMC